MIEILFETVDGVNRRLEFPDLAAAQAWAQKRIGTMFDISDTFGYVIDGYGIVKLTPSGTDPYTLMGITRS